MINRLYFDEALLDSGMCRTKAVIEVDLVNQICDQGDNKPFWLCEGNTNYLKTYIARLSAEQLAEIHKEIVGRIYTTSNGTFFKGSSVLGLYKFKKVTWGVGILHNYFLLIRGEVVGLWNWNTGNREEQVALEMSVSGECNSGLLGWELKSSGLGQRKSDL